MHSLLRVRMLNVFEINRLFRMLTDILCYPFSKGGRKTISLQNKKEMKVNHSRSAALFFLSEWGDE